MAQQPCIKQYVHWMRLKHMITLTKHLTDVNFGDSFYLCPQPI